VPASGGAPSRLLASGPIFDSAPSDSRASFTLFDEILFTRRGELFSVELAEPARPTLLDELPEGAVVVGDVEGFDLAPSGELVVYTALETDDLAPALYSVSTSKPQERVRILPEPQGQPLGSPRLVPDGNRVLFLRTSEYSADNDLYSAPSDGSGAPVVLDAALGASARVFDFQITPDGRRVVIEAFVDDRYSLYSAPADGASAPVLLYPSRFEYVHQLSRAKISADSSRIAFLEELRLYAAPIDGSSPAVLLTADSVAPDFQLTADGSQVVFRKANGRLGLFVVPADRSSAPRRLDAPMQPRAAVASFTLAPDASRVVYLGDQAADETFELFSVLLDGSAPPARLHLALAAGRDVLPGFQVASDGRRVVYRADALADEALDLFGAPLDASRPPLLLSPGRIPDGDVLDFRISPDGQRVVYRADRESDEVVGLYGVSLRGGRGVLELGRAPVPGGDVQAYQISADSSTVAFTAERDSAGAVTLLSAPIGGGQKATELAGPFVEGGTVHDFALSADGARVVWRADQDERGVIELYAAPGRALPPAKRP
jgi:Tol biopolymer transport system component